MEFFTFLIDHKNKSFLQRMNDPNPKWLGGCMSIIMLIQTPHSCNIQRMLESSWYVNISDRVMTLVTSLGFVWFHIELKNLWEIFESNDAFSEGQSTYCLVYNDKTVLRYNYILVQLCTRTFLYNEKESMQESCIYDYTAAIEPSNLWPIYIFFSNLQTEK